MLIADLRLRMTIRSVYKESVLYRALPMTSVCPTSVPQSSYSMALQFLVV